MQHRILTRELKTTATASEFYAELCTKGGKPKAHTALFETAAVGQLHHVKSLLMLSAAVRIECRGKQVHFISLSENGEHFLQDLQPLFNVPVPILNTDTGFIIDCQIDENTNQQLDEEARLRSFSIFEPLRQTQKLLRSGDAAHDAVTFLFGYFAYDLVDQFEDIPQAASGEKNIPDYVYYLADQLLIRDEQHDSAKLFTLAFDRAANNLSLNTELNQLVESLESIDGGDGENIPVVTPSSASLDIEAYATMDKKTFKQGIEVIRKHVLAGDVFQTVLSRKFAVPCDDAFAAYQVLKQHNPSPYMFFLQGRDHSLFGASPESAVKFTASDREVTIYPIAGTHKRGTHADGSVDPDLDSRIEASLRQNAKEIAEHMMLVDLARNDVARVCKSGTRKIRELQQIVRYAHVMHLVSEVIGELDEGLDALHAYQACHNMGTLVGAPKIKATTILRGLEDSYRGTYGGAVGYLNAAGDMDTAIIIRSALVKDGKGIVQAGAGIVLDSDPESEAQETCNKAAAVINACLAVSDSNNDAVQKRKALWTQW